MGYVEAIRVTPDQLDTCDYCGQQGLKTSGHIVKDSYGEPMIFMCFNCKHKLLGKDQK